VIRIGILKVQKEVKMVARFNRFEIEMESVPRMNRGPRREPSRYPGSVVYPGRVQREFNRTSKDNSGCFGTLEDESEEVDLETSRNVPKPFRQTIAA